MAISVVHPGLLIYLPGVTTRLESLGQRRLHSLSAIALFVLVLGCGGGGRKHSSGRWRWRWHETHRPPSQRLNDSASKPLQGTSTIHRDSCVRQNPSPEPSHSLRIGVTLWIWRTLLNSASPTGYLNATIGFRGCGYVSNHAPGYGGNSNQSVSDSQPISLVYQGTFLFLVFMGQHRK